MELDTENSAGLSRYKSKRRICPHCEQSLSLKTFKSHKRLYFNQKSSTWSTIQKRWPSAATDSSDSDSANSPSSTLTFSTSCPNDDTATPLQDEFEEMEYNNESSGDLLLSEGEHIPDEEEEIWVDDEETSRTFECDIGEGEPRDFTVIRSMPTEHFAIVRWITLFLLQLQAAYHLPNRAVDCLFRFIATFLLVLSRFTNLSKQIVECFPSTLYKAKRHFVNRLEFIRYVVCRKCFNIYTIKDSIEGASASQRSKLCSYRQYPDHPHRSRRGSCQALLMKSIQLIGGKRILYPFLVYCYLGVETTLQQITQRPNVDRWCEEWRQRPTVESYSDVYDGKMWQAFMNCNESPFLSEPNNLALILNMDFFQPYKHLKGYSVGALYCVILNLPRGVRYKQENVLLIGLIPGPSEPPHDINSFLNPMVEELKIFYSSGKQLLCCNGQTKNFKCVLLCVACDIPAGRKVCGFMGHTARFACSRCFKRFPGDFGNFDFSGFERDSWPNRDGKTHRRVALGMRTFTSQAEQERKESQAGFRYSSLLQLPYFDAPRMLVVDPMHNLFLGTSKRIMQYIWIPRLILKDHDFKVIQERVDKILVPPGIGRIPVKIQSGFSSFSADQWKNWTLYYSTMVLFDILNTSDLECWRHFVLGCRILCKHTLTKTELQLGDALLIRFCKKVEELYGKNEITLNMHLHGHIKSCIEDFGPPHGFWVYAFERYNGILENVSTNNRCIEPQLVERFVNDTLVLSSQLPSEFSESFYPHFASMQCNTLAGPRHLVGSLADTILPSSASSSLSSWEYDKTTMVLPSCRSKYILSSLQTQALQELYTKLLSVTPSSIDMPSICWKYISVTFQGKVLGSHNSHSHSSSIVLATWNRDLFGFPLSSIVEDLVSSDNLVRPARIDSLLLHQPNINGEHRSFLLVALSWYKFHPQMLKLGKPLTVWCSNIFETDSIYSIVPIQLIQCRTASLVTKLNGESALIVCPCINF